MTRAISPEERRARALADKRVARAAARYAAGASIRQVAQEVGMSHEWVRRQLHYAGVPLRSAAEAASRSMTEYWERWFEARDEEEGAPTNPPVE